MTKLIIDERDIRCTIRERVRKLLGLTEFAEQSIDDAAGPIINAVLALGDKPAESASLGKLEQIIGHMMTTPMRQAARAECLVEMLTIVNGLRMTPSPDFDRGVVAGKAVSTRFFLGELNTLTKRAKESLDSFERTIRDLEPRARRLVHTECLRMPGGTGPCACLDGCGACDSCGNWLGENDNEPKESAK